MGKHDAVIRAQLEVHCLGCERPYLGLGPTKTNAIEELLRHYWAKVGGKWFCPSCTLQAVRDYSALSPQTGAGK